MSRTRAILQTLERMENKENARSVSSLPYGIKIGEYRELPEGRKHVRLWAEGVEPWFKLAGWRVEGHEAHMKCILYLSTRLAASKSASGWWRGQRQLHGDYGGFSTVQGFLKALVSACGEQNAVEKARTALLHLQQKGSVVDYATRFSAIAAELPAEEGPGWLAFLFQRGLKQGLRAIILGKYAANATWTQIRDIAITHDSVAQEAAAAAAAQHGGVPMDLGNTQAADSDEDDAAERTTRRRAPTPGRGPRDGVCWDCGKPGHFRGAPGCPKHNGGAASASGSKVNGSRR